VRKICKIKDFRNREVFEIEDKKFFLIKIEENYFFLESICKHMGGPLEKGILKDNLIECPWHGCKFDCKTGKSPNSSHELITKKVIIKDGYICL
jgi:nitrite reductase/ring-hydroxylating ferredoxin subunit